MSEGAVGRCYLCGAPAVRMCRQCHRPVCDGHLVALDAALHAFFGSEACTECVRFTVEDLARDEGQWARKRALDRPQRTCAVCGREFEQVLPQCSRCGRHLCPEHRVRYRRKFRFGARGWAEEAWYWDHEVRCPEHRMLSFVAWLKGWKVG